MGLDDFEKELAQSRRREDKDHRSRDKDEDSDRRRRHRHHQHSHRHRHDEDDRESRRSHKRHHDRGDDDERRRRKRHRSGSPQQVKKAVEAAESLDDVDEDEWVEKEALTAPPEEDILDQREGNLEGDRIQRDAWMREPAALDIEYTQSRRPKTPPGQFVGAKSSHEFKVHNAEISQHLADLDQDFETDDEGDATGGKVKDEPAQHSVSYVFGDSGSSWRMTKLKAVYRQAEDSGRAVDEVALERYGDFREFDDAREEEREMSRRKMYGKEYVGLEKPSGEFFQERKLKAGIRRESRPDDEGVGDADLAQGKRMPELETAATTVSLDPTALNKLRAQMMKAKLRNAPEAARLEEEYNLAASGAATAHSDVVVLHNMENRMLAGDRSGEVTAVSGKRGRERGLVEENEDMSIEDMVRNEKRTRHMQGGEGKAFAERIAKDSKYVDDLDYMDDNAQKLSKKVVQSETNLRNTAIGDYQKMQKVLHNCPLCYHEDSDQPPTAPVISLATRTYMTLATEPEVAKGGAVIVPVQHHFNLLECDDDEWEEMRNFMKSLTRFYHAQDRGVIFYENAAHMSSRKGHAALNAIPLPTHLAENAPAYFKEAILASDEQWSQHKPIIDTLALAKRPGYGKAAFRKAMVREMPYFHVFFTLDGGMGHVIEDERRWPKGDLFAREVLGGMLDKGPEVIKRQGRWERHDRRLDGFRKKWDPFDWTKALLT